MTLSYTKPGFLLEGKLNSAQINPDEKSLLQNADIFTSIKDLTDKAGKSFIVGMPGEFEVNDVTIYAYKLNTSTKEIFDTIRVQIEDINVLYLANSHDRLKPEDIEMLGDIHLVILDANSANLKNIFDSIREIEPYYLIFRKDNESYDEFMKQVGGNIEELKKLKVDSKEFIASDESSIQTKVVVLT